MQRFEKPNQKMSEKELFHALEENHEEYEKDKSKKRNLYDSSHLTGEVLTDTVQNHKE